MALSKYKGAGEIYINGRLIAEATDMEFTIRSNDNKVMTMQKGMAGFSDGPTEVEGTINSAVPKAGYDHEFLDTILDKKEVRVTWITAGNRRVTAEGRFGELRERFDSASPASSSIPFMGKILGSL